MTEIEKLEKKINQLRKKMYTIYESNPTDSKLLEVSQELDSLLNDLWAKSQSKPKDAP
ncbi:aspartyl-phosphate phosphatase Spo0E family protein [Thalassobacillus sp. CUG 92003]|uniref:aspartyl-phosphate phosphatase Spo0E family protein n=1 Tax=Thalassobacillus sp. CUG 92003 TaxID=2736641 RepID=UPI0015E656FD|nr:aspartyl-phosphate phosphatase Spo0E family protein [Thalassobacillus sp. CUG 92003]